MIPPVGKSGALTKSNNSSQVISLLFTYAIQPSITSVKLWGAIFVAIPTASPDEPFTSKFGTFVGKTDGSTKLSSKFGLKSTVSFSRSSSISSVILRSLASV